MFQKTSLNFFVKVKAAERGCLSEKCWATHVRKVARAPFPCASQVSDASSTGFCFVRQPVVGDLGEAVDVRWRLKWRIVWKVL